MMISLLTIRIRLKRNTLSVGSMLKAATTAGSGVTNEMLICLFFKMYPCSCIFCVKLLTVDNLSAIAFDKTTVPFPRPRSFLNNPSFTNSLTAWRIVIRLTPNISSSSFSDGIVLPTAYSLLIILCFRISFICKYKGLESFERSRTII